MNSSTFNILSHARRIVVPGIAAVALMAPAAAWAILPAAPANVAPPEATLPDLAPADPTDVGRPEAGLPDLPPASPTAVGGPVVPITLPDPTRFSPQGIFQSPAPSTLPDLAPANPTQVTPEELPAHTTLPDLAPANPTQVTPEELPTRTTLPELPPASPTLAAAPADQPAASDGFDFGDAGIGVAVVAGACALLLALAAFLVGRRRHRLGASHS